MSSVAVDSVGAALGGWMAECTGASGAGSLFAVADADRVAVAAALAARDRWVHVDVILSADGSWHGVPAQTLVAVRHALPHARVEVHLIDLDGGPGRPRPDRVDDALATVLPQRPQRVVLPAHRCSHGDPALRMVRAAGAQAWVEVRPGADLPRVQANLHLVDGALVMLIDPGTREAADLRHLDAVRTLAPHTPVGVDGGVGPANVAACLAAGATHLVSGRGLLTGAARTTATGPATSPDDTSPERNAMSTTSANGAPPEKMRLPETMRASVLTGVRQLEVQERPVPRPLPGEVVVEVAAVGVCGSDVHYYREGRIGGFVVDAPLILGHEVSGRIAAVGEGVDGGRVGERVAIEPQRPCRVCRQCAAGRYNLCPHMEFYATPPVDGAFTRFVTAPSVFAHPIPDSLSDEAGALLEPLSVGIATLRKARTVPGDTVLIAGAGPIGVIAAQTARAFGAREVIVSDPVAERRQRVLGYGATAVVDPLAEDLVALDLGVDAFIDASGAAPAVVSGIKSVRPGGSAVLVGLGASDVLLPVSTIQDREINLTGIFRYTDTWPLAAHLVASGQVQMDSLVTGHFDLDHVAEALESDRNPDSLKSIVHPA
jgi:2-desacetyl-2-hydroxyethyl bacteriochlorophyllide A dehydrogenase